MKILVIHIAIKSIYGPVDLSRQGQNIGSMIDLGNAYRAVGTE